MPENREGKAKEGLSSRWRRVLLYVLGVYIVGALCTASTLLTLAIHQPSAKNIADAADYAIIWPQAVWWNSITRGHWAVFFGLLIFGSFPLPPLVLLLFLLLLSLRFINRPS